LTPVLICLETGWTWRELMETPAEVVDDLLTLLRVRGNVERARRKVEEARGRQ
jgi:hypothetical protein